MHVYINSAEKYHLPLLPMSEDGEDVTSQPPVRTKETTSHSDVYTPTSRSLLTDWGLTGDIFAILWGGAERSTQSQRMAKMSPSSGSKLASRLPLDPSKTLATLQLLEGMDSRNNTLQHVILLKCRQHVMHTPMKLLQTQAHCSFHPFESFLQTVMYRIGCQPYLLPRVFQNSSRVNNPVFHASSCDILAHNLGH